MSVSTHQAPAAVRIAVAGAGLIGRRHIEEIQAYAGTELCGIADPSPQAADLAAALGVPVHRSVPELLAEQRPDGVVVATPNLCHHADAVAVIDAGIPVLVEKPLAVTVTEAADLVTRAEAAGVALLTGHHRTHSAVMAAAREVIASGRLGRLVAVQGNACFHKPDAYFDVGDGWRRRPGGGPIQLNLIHDVDNLRQLLGPITEVQASVANAARGFAVEDTAAVLLRFANGALGTFLLSDVAASARSWEQTAGENLSYERHQDEDAYVVMGTRGSLAIPTMRLKFFPGEASWTEPLRTEQLQVAARDPLAAQISHFAAVIRGAEKPLCDGRAGLAAVAVVTAILTASRTGSTVPVHIP
ncbi:oxidoreductase [Enemella dayhoffiae]|uniref:Oxidoreductase n=1 Tax=Enemella dayhoffiae TaxID=2016507 RepID=A0A255GL73_9ACTN|nr:Gfo/Idh/MocA family oxidoreductase [Enemella dayhoffiae]OYO16588.1 oxidoreductase [Enemella dayhoffiae]